MKYEKYISLIKKLENSAQKNPSTYRLQVFLTALLGYAYFGLILSLPVILILFVIGAVIFKPGGLLLLIKVLGKIVWLLAALALGAVGSFWGAVKAMFAPVEPPKGYELRPDEAPQLFADIKEAGEFLKAPEPEHLLLTPEFNAAIVNLPKRGVFGTKSYLCLGLPLIETLSPQQLKAVIAHEMGHFSGRHGKGSRWIYQMRETWGRFAESQEIQGDSSIKILYEPFLKWYFPYFNAHSFVLARQQEREADRLAVQVAGAKPLAEALICLEVKSRLLEQNYWKEIYEQAKVQEKPPEQVFSKMFLALREYRDESAEVLAFSQAIAARTDYTDTHPSLKERLEALNFDYREIIPVMPKTEHSSAANYYLGKLADDLTRRFDAEWHREASEPWRAQHEYFERVEKRIEELNAKSLTEVLTDEELYEIAILSADRHEASSALPILNELLRRNPDFAPARHMIGMILLDADDENGIDELERAQSLDPTFAVAALERIYSFLFAKGRDDEASLYLKRLEEFYEVVDLARKERETITDQDRLKVHDVPEQIVEKIKKTLSYHEEIEAAYLTAKEVKYFPNEPCYILGLKTKKKHFWSKREIKDNDLLEIIANRAGEVGIHYVLILNKFKTLEKQMQNTSQALIYEA